MILDHSLSGPALPPQHPRLATRRAVGRAFCQRPHSLRSLGDSLPCPVPSPLATSTLPLSVFTRSRWSLASTHPTAPASSPPATPTLPLSSSHRSRWSLGPNASHRSRVFAARNVNAPPVRLHPLPLVARLNAIARSARSANHAPALRRTSSVIRPQTVPIGLPPFRSALPFRLRCAGLRPVGGRNVLRP